MLCSVEIILNKIHETIFSSKCNILGTLILAKPSCKLCEQNCTCCTKSMNIYTARVYIGLINWLVGRFED